MRGPANLWVNFGKQKADDRVSGVSGAAAAKIWRFGG